MAVHVVTRPIPPNNNPTSSSSTEQHQFPPNIQINYTAANQPHIVTQNVIYGQVPFERTQIFREPNNALVKIFCFQKFLNFRQLLVVLPKP